MSKSCMFQKLHFQDQAYLYFIFVPPPPSPSLSPSECHLTLSSTVSSKHQPLFWGYTLKSVIADPNVLPLNSYKHLTRFDVYETLCPQQMLVHKGGQIKNWSGEYRGIIPTKLQCQAIQRALQSPNLQREIIPKK